MGSQFVTNAGSLAARQRYRANFVDQALKDACRAYGAAVMAQAINLSRGPLKTAALNRIKPGLYSKKRPVREMFDAIINVQTGQFENSWHFGTWAYSGHVVVTVWNSAPYAKYMMGTTFMRERPVLDRALRRLSVVGDPAGTSGAYTPPAALSAQVATNSPTSQAFVAYMLNAKRSAESGASVGRSLLDVVISTAATYGSAVLDV